MHSGLRCQQVFFAYGSGDSVCSGVVLGNFNYWGTNTVALKYASGFNFQKVISKS